MQRHGRAWVILGLFSLLAGCRSAAERPATGSTPTSTEPAPVVAATATAPASPPPAAAAPAGRAAGAGPTGAASPKAARSDAVAARGEREAAEAKRRWEPPRQAEQSILTAGVWDDAKNFDFFLAYARPLAQRTQDFSSFSFSELRGAHEESTLARRAKRELDVAIVFDTTGSMGDELSFLQREMASIASRLRERFPQVEPRFALSVYKDRGDAYVSKSFPFTSSVPAFQRTLAAQSAGGGGDYPEAVVAGLRDAARLEWRGGQDVGKVAFWIGDAPAHPGEGRELADVIREAKQKGIRLYPIAASGADDLTEYQMRTAALMTGGRYLFLTDDSGVGNAHAEPHIPCYSVTKLDVAILRMLSIELSGEPVAIASEDVVRTVGSPERDGTCQLRDGQRVASF